MLLSGFLPISRLVWGRLLPAISDAGINLLLKRVQQPVCTTAWLARAFYEFETVRQLRYDSTASFCCLLMSSTAWGQMRRRRVTACRVGGFGCLYSRRVFPR